MSDLRALEGSLGKTLSIFMPLTVTAFLWLTSPNVITPVDGLCAFLLLFLVGFTYSRWRVSSRDSFPLFPAVCSVYWIAFALPLFWGPRRLGIAFLEDYYVSDASITLAMVLVGVGILSFGFGMRSGIGRRWILKAYPDIQADPARWTYLRMILVVGCFVGWYGNSNYILGEGGRQILIILQTTIPTVAFAVLFRGYLLGEIQPIDRFLIVLYVSLRLIGGLSSGWVGTFASTAITCAALYISERRKTPKLAIVIVAIYVLFFQVAKEPFREAYWDAGETGTGMDRLEAGGRMERLAFWTRESKARWKGALTGTSGETVIDLLYVSTSRLSLLTQAAHVVELTPSEVPYQHWLLYSYLPISLIPRFLWPQKPSIDEANKFYQITYGLAYEEMPVSIAVGSMTEGYISFGWLGVACVMFLIGVFMDFVQRNFFSKDTGILMKALGVTLLPQLLSAESQMAAYIGGLIQQIFLTILIFLPAIHFVKLKTSDQPPAAVLQGAQ